MSVILRVLLEERSGRSLVYSCVCVCVCVCVRVRGHGLVLV